MSVPSSVAPLTVHSFRGEAWHSLPLETRRVLLKEDRQAGESVSLILASIVVLGALMMAGTILYVI